MNAEAIALIDATLPITQGRELVGADEVADLLLDLRQLLSEEDTHADPEKQAIGASWGAMEELT